MAKVIGGGPAKRRLVPVARAQVVANSLARRPVKPSTTAAFSRAHRSTPVRASAPAIPKPPTSSARPRVGQTVTDAMRNAPAARKALAGVLRKK